MHGKRNLMESTMQHLYTATFSTGETREQIFSRELTYAWRVTYTRNGSRATKYGFSGTREKAEKAAKLSPLMRKVCTDVTSEVVPATKLREVPKATAKPKKVKPFAKGEEVVINLIDRHGDTTILATVKGIRGDTVTVTIPQFLNDVRVKLANVQKLAPHPTPLAQAA